MIKSMTAFARAEKQNENFHVIIEIRSLNSRYLDIITRIPSSIYAYDDKVKKTISEYISRGRIEVSIQMEDKTEEEQTFQVDFKRAKAYYTSLSEIKEHFKIEGGIDLDLLLRAGDLIKPIQIEKDSSKAWPVIQSCLNDALDEIVVMRDKEGDAISKDFESRLLLMENQMNIIGDFSKDLISASHERLKERIKLLTKGLIELDESRIVQEAAFIADKSDISEEIVRIKSHISQFRNLIQSEEPAGRKLNFLLQELGREFNTIGAKTGSVDISHTIVILKAEQEKIREQVQNIE